MDRPEYQQRIVSSFRVHPIVALLGPRQCGKTTLARMFAQSEAKVVHAFDLEDPRDLARLENPLLALEDLQGLIVIDEVQRRPDIFPVLRVLVDQPDKQRQFLLLGSASRDLLRQSSESLAGRIEYVELSPFSVNETHDAARTWWRGGFPRSYLADTDADSARWRSAYMTTYLEQDIPNLGISIPAPTLRRFWSMLAHYHGNVLNLSELGASFGIAHTTVRRYLDILTGTFMVRQLSPWWENIAKRQVKAPKIYIRDSGILHSLMGLTERSQLDIHPKLGASWEGFALEEVVRRYAATDSQFYFWATHGGAELDLLVIRGGERLGFEFKFTDRPKLTKSMQIALDELHLDQLYVVVPQGDGFPLARNVRVTDLSSLIDA